MSFTLIQLSIVLLKLKVNMICVHVAQSTITTLKCKNYSSHNIYKLYLYNIFLYFFILCFSKSAYATSKIRFSVILCAWLIPRYLEKKIISRYLELCGLFVFVYHTRGIHRGIEVYAPGATVSERPPFLPWLWVTRLFMIRYFRQFPLRNWADETIIVRNNVALRSI